MTDEEKEQLGIVESGDPMGIAVLACYESLFGWDIDQKCSAVSAFKRMIELQIKQPEEEDRLRGSLKSLGTITDDVSLKVREMYEKNPYPRWRSLNVSPGTHEYKGDTLIAGCGTGRYLIQTALTFPHVDFTAVDITRASLAYSMRMAETYEAKNIDFFQCDILELDRLEKTFDFINCSGVLHHMADPLAGWRGLMGRLNAGGCMLISLYSTIARQIIFDGRKEIQQQNFPATDDGIRAFRHYVFSLPPGGKLNRLLMFKDFYTLSETRDLLFHVQEKTYTIPELQSVFEELGLDFMGFKMPSPDVAKIYREYYPDDPKMINLKNWEAFETKHPNVFAGMYNFLCKKKGRYR